MDGAPQELEWRGSTNAGGSFSTYDGPHAWTSHQHARTHNPLLSPHPSSHAIPYNLTVSCRVSRPIHDPSLEFSICVPSSLSHSGIPFPTLGTGIEPEPDTIHATSKYPPGSWLDLSLSLSLTSLQLGFQRHFFRTCTSFQTKFMGYGLWTDGTRDSVRTHAAPQSLKPRASKWTNVLPAYIA